MDHRHSLLACLPQSLNSQAVGSFFKIESWNSGLGGQDLFAAEMEKTFSFSVSAQYELCIHPALMWIKSLPAVKFFDFFSMVFRPLEILILNPFSNIKFLVKVKDRIPLF